MKLRKNKSISKLLRHTTSRILILYIFSSLVACSSPQKPSITFTVAMENPSEHTFQVKMECTGMEKEYVDFKIPMWSPGYYQILNFAENIENFAATDENGTELAFEKHNENTWRVTRGQSSSIVLNYDVKTVRTFVAIPYLDEERGYIIPTGVMLHPTELVQTPSKIIIDPYEGWDKVATGLDAVEGENFTFMADNFDALYDSPLLVGKLEELPSFTVKGVPHYFMGYKMGEFNKEGFINDLKKVTEAATDIIGDVPFKHYTFIGIGPGRGGIEHLNSTTVSFNGNSLSDTSSYQRMLNFLAHEYFHHYNVKRIRPIELGPFDYDKENRTKMLWLSEGVSVYYEYLAVKRAGLCNETQLLGHLKNDILAYERKPGRLFQSLAESSYETWEDGPFGRVGDEFNKTISYYDKGPIVGWLFDFAIRHETKNEKSLDDVMRFLYNHYYKELGRGFTEDELREALETAAGTKLDELFTYIYTTEELDYNKYLAYAGYQIDVTPQPVAGGWLGATASSKNDSLFIKDVEWKSPAWEGGLRKGDLVLDINGAEELKNIISTKKEGDIIQVTVRKDTESKKISIPLGTKMFRSFEFSKLDSLTELQQKIQQSWLGEVAL
ncbi:PDZ domain-containing protein [Flammeovirgaceae bacterium SG7u.111]|nr:PDZ domain-containing protein [Flammeovirgaceae bacterium SG7u.132]WPO34987.1 PDZ domain-containing protein [Flammeovirgaceae bacterium SG7u.111]